MSSSFPPPPVDTSDAASFHRSSTAAVKPAGLAGLWERYMAEVGLLNSMLVFGPPAVLLRCLGLWPTCQFFLACFAIVPLAGFLGEATEHLSDDLGPGTGGLLNATFGNAAELIIASFSVFRSLDTLVKSSLVGSIIGNLLLVLGASILFGGIRFASQSFSINAANIDSNMCVVAAIGFLVPSMFHSFNSVPDEATEHKLSLGISLIFLATYLFMLFFQLKTHAYFFDKQQQQQQQQQKQDQHSSTEQQSVPSRHPAHSASHSHSEHGHSSTSSSHYSGGVDNGTVSERSSLLRSSSVRPFGPGAARRPFGPTSSFHIPRSFRKAQAAAGRSSRQGSDGSTTPLSAGGTPSTPSFERLARSLDRRQSVKRDEYGAVLVDVVEGEGADGGGEQKMGGDGSMSELAILPGVTDLHSEHEEHWSMRRSLAVLLSATLGIVLLSEVLTGAVEHAGEALGLTPLFVGVIIVAIVGNAAEHSTAVISALHNDMDIALSIAFGSALQIAMFVMPLVVALSYLREGRPMDLTLSDFEVFGVTCATIISWMVVQDGASTWLEGLMLLVIYAILALAFFFAKDDSH